MCDAAVALHLRQLDLQFVQLALVLRLLHRGLSDARKRLSRLAFVTTESEESAIAAPAIIGLSYRPTSG